jgi:hypothetical protein
MQQETLVATCAMNVKNFPFDTQNCTMTYRSQYYNNNLLNMNSNNNSGISAYNSNNGKTGLYVRLVCIHDGSFMPARLPLTGGC